MGAGESAAADDPENQLATVPEDGVTQKGVNAAMLKGFEDSDPHGRSAQKQVEQDMVSNAESSMPVQVVVQDGGPRGRRPSGAGSDGSRSSKSSLGGSSANFKAGNTKRVKPRWEADDEEDVKIGADGKDGQGSNVLAGALQPIPEAAQGTGKREEMPENWPWAKPNHRRKSAGAEEDDDQDDDDGDYRTVADQTDHRVMLRSYEDYLNDGPAAEKVNTRRSAVEMNTGLGGIPTAGVNTTARPRASQSNLLHASSVPNILDDTPETRMRELKDIDNAAGLGYNSFPASKNDEDDMEGDDDDEPGPGGDDDEEAEKASAVIKKEEQLKEQIATGVTTLEAEKEEIAKHERDRKLEQISASRASNVIRQVAEMKKTYVDQRMRLFEDSVKMGRELKLREKKLMTWIALLTVLHKFDEKLSCKEIQDRMTDAHLRSLPDAPPPPPREEAPDQDDEKLHEEYERMRAKYQSKWESEGKRILGEAKFEEIRNMSKTGPAEKQKRLIAQKNFQRALDVMSEAQHKELLKRAWRLENNWQPYTLCEPLSFASTKLKDMDEQEKERARQSAIKRRALQNAQGGSGKHAIKD